MKKLSRPKDHPATLVVAEETLWLTADRETLVPDGHPDAAFLFSSPGAELPVEEAEKYGLLPGKQSKAKAEAAEEDLAAEPEKKQSAPAANKKRSPSRSKAKK